MWINQEDEVGQSLGAASVRSVPPTISLFPHNSGLGQCCLLGESKDGLVPDPIGR
jgi:hypothetical protein